MSLQVKQIKVLKEELETLKSNLLDFDKKCNSKGNCIVKLVVV